MNRTFLAFCLMLTSCFTASQADATGDALLYSTERSSCALRTRIILHYKNIPFAIKSRPSPEIYKQLNPQEKVPLLIIDELILSQTLAIAEYLEETRPTRLLLPENPAERAKVRRICMIVAADIQPLQNLAVLDHLAPERRLPWARYWIRKGLSALEEILADGSGPYATGENFTLADAFLYPQLRNAQLFEVDLEPYPTLQRIHSTLQQHPAILEALNDKHK